MHISFSLCCSLNEKDYTLISVHCNTELWSLSSDQVSGNRLHKGPSIFNFTWLFLTGTHWFWTETHDFSQDESKDSM